MTKRYFKVPQLPEGQNWAWNPGSGDATVQALPPSVSQLFPSYIPAGFKFFEASAKENINVKQVFERLVDVICEKMNESLEPSSSPGSNGKGPALGDTPLPHTSSCPC